MNPTRFWQFFWRSRMAGGTTFFHVPTKKGMAYFRQTLVDYAKAQKKAAQLAASLKDPLRSELKRASSSGTVRAGHSENSRCHRRG
jgi:hypothetical protein